jgi:hypothetical protein
MTVTTIDLDPALIEAVKAATGATTLREATLRAYETTLRIYRQPRDLVQRVAELGLGPADFAAPVVDYEPDPAYVVAYEGPSQP